MLTLTPGCACDVCAEEYGTHRPPHSIPCGHVLCASCIQTIVEKTNPRLSPVCPFCRESFTNNGARLIRMDFATGGWTTPRRFPAADTINTINSDVLQRRTAHLFSAPADGPRARGEVRRLEDKVSRIAAKKCSVEEVSTLYKELEDWLLNEKDDQTSSLFLSAALLRAILMNHLAHSEASKAAKTVEANLRHKIEGYEAELKKQRNHYAQKAQECTQLRTELNQLRALATTLPNESTAHSHSHPTSPTYASSPSSPPPTHNYNSHSASTSPTPYSSSQSHYPSSSASAAAAATAPMLTRFNSLHGRSTSTSASSARPTTPAALAHAYSQQPTSTASPTRSHTPAPRSHTPGPPASASAAYNAAYTSATSPQRSHTPASSASAQARSHTPAPRSHTPSLMRSHTPAPPVPPMPSRYATPTPGGGSYGLSSSSSTPHPYPAYGHGHSSSLSMSNAAYGNLGLRAQTPGPAPLVPPKPRRLSLSGNSPPRTMARSTSEEKAEAHQRWLPPHLGVSKG